jgi:hypothetical protein
LLCFIIFLNESKNLLLRDIKKNSKDKSQKIKK